MRLRLVAACLVLIGCKGASSNPSAGPEPSAAQPVASASKAPLRLGEPIGAQDAPEVALAAIANDPAAYENKVVTTRGTVVAVCQHMGCWMELREAGGEAHVKMHGHSFFVPKTAAGHQARVKATVLKTDPSDECSEEAAEQMGRPVAKVQLEATGVELD